MTNFSYNRDIPDGPHNPSVDQPNMKINTNSTDDLINVDHYSFNVNNGGLHKMSTYPATTTPAAQSGFSGVAFTAPGLALPTAGQYRYKNSQGTFPLSGVRAFGVFTLGRPPGPTTTITALNQFNVASSSASTLSNITTATITLVANSINASVSNQAVVFAESSSLNFSVFSYSIDAAGVITITMTGIAASITGIILNVVVLQA